MYLIFSYTSIIYIYVIQKTIETLLSKGKIMATVHTYILFSGRTEIVNTVEQIIYYN